jgi:hypothetical protein
MTTALVRGGKLRRPRPLPSAMAIAAILLLVVWSFFSVSTVAQGWLIAFVFWSSIGIGSVVLLLIHRLTGGAWGTAAAPVLLPAALTLPLAIAAFVPLAFNLSGLYGWAAGAAQVPGDVSRLYLNHPAFLIRGFVALFGWSVLAVLLARDRCTRLTAALGLAFHGIAISAIAVDWILSIDPGFASSAFGAGTAFQQLLLALAFTVAVGPTGSSNSCNRDLGGLLLATLLGTFYVDLMSFIVGWYGDLPEKAEWYLHRGQKGWEYVVIATVAIGVIIPFAMLLRADMRASRIGLRVAGCLVLIGVFLHIVWLMAPPFQEGAIPASTIALIALAALSVTLIDVTGISPGNAKDG